MSQPKPRLGVFELGDFWIEIETESAWSSVFLSTAKTKKTAYKRAAAKLRKLADEAERLADE